MREIKARRLSDETVKTVKLPPKGKRTVIPDSVVKGLRLRVTSTGAASWIFNGRFEKGGNTTNRLIGDARIMPVAEARNKAREFVAHAEKREDPKAVQRAAQAARGELFGDAMESYIQRHVRNLRRAKIVEREIRRELLPRFKDYKVREVTRVDIIKMVDEIAKRAPYSARTALEHIKTFYNDAVMRGLLGDHGVSPAAVLRPLKLLGKGKIKKRKHVLKDEELPLVWDAAEKLGYPYGPLWQLILLTGARKEEIGEMKWDELDLEARTLTIPPERYKTDKVHTIPLSDHALDIIAKLPRGTGDYVFSYSGGLKPVNGWSVAKRELNKLIGNKVAHFVTHDLRRTVRTQLSKLGVVREVAELVIGHTKPGLDDVYDQHEALDERRAALTLWANHLRGPRKPPAKPKVVKLRQKAA